MDGNRPTTFDLIESVCEFLENKIIPRVDEYTAFHTRVAINVLGIVEREIRLGRDLDAGEHNRLSINLGRDATLEELNSLLCKSIREGKIDYNDPDLIEHMTKTTMGKLSIDNPNYSAYKQALEK